MEVQKRIYKSKIQKYNFIINLPFKKAHNPRYVKATHLYIDGEAALSVKKDGLAHDLVNRILGLR